MNEQEIEAMKEIIRDVAATDPYIHDFRRDVSECMYCDAEFVFGSQNHDANCTYRKAVALVEQWEQKA